MFDPTDTHTEGVIIYILVYCLSTMCLMLKIFTCIHNIVSVMSSYRGRHVINPGGDVIGRESDAMKAVVVMSYSWCHVVYNGYDVVNYSRCDFRNKVGVISSILSM